MPRFFLPPCRCICKGEQTRFNNTLRTMPFKWGSSHYSCIETEEEESRHPLSFAWSGTGLKPGDPPPPSRSRGRDREGRRFKVRTPGSTPEHLATFDLLRGARRKADISSLRLSQPLPRRHCKEDQAPFGDMFLKGRIFNLLD